MRRMILMAACVVMTACGAKQKVEQQPAPIATDQLEIDGNRRLSEAVVPTRYTLDLSVDPAAERFSGQVEIAVQVHEADTRVIYLHAEELAFTKAQARSGDAVIKGEVVPGDNGGVALVLDQPLNAGPAVLEFAYDASLDEVPTGLYRVEDNGRWYAFTQFEPLEARQAFPSFDEPKFKTPFKTTLRVPKGQIGLSNAPEVEHRSDTEHEIFVFDETRPLPTYLVAFAVGEFDVVEAPEGAIEGVPFRLIATKGKGELGAFMLEQTPKILRAISEYFGQPYPFAKLDVIAVPNFSAGAMENVGLVTFRERLLLLDPQTAALSDRRSAVSVMAHELAHFWFGNLVTMPWWDELWLNEAFATWMAHKILVEMMPELEADIDTVLTTGRVMGIDSLAQARAIRQPIDHGGDVYNAFDGITYGKGAAVIRMFEAWMGAEALEQGLRAYMRENAYGHGTTEELLAALDAAASKPVGETMKSFLDQPGVPLLAMKLTCEKGAQPTLSVSQSRYLPADSEAEQGTPWRVPVCVRYAKGSGSETFCELLDAPEKSFALPAKSCPRWIYPNADQVGYYRWKLEDDAVQALTRKHRAELSAAERVGLFANLDALVEARQLDPATYLQALEAMASETHRTILNQVIGGLYGLEEIVPEAQREAFEKRAKKLLAPHIKRIGYQSAPDEPAELALIRPKLLRALAYLAGDEQALTLARETSAQFLKKMSSVESSQAKFALPVTAWSGDSSLWLSYRMAVDDAPTPAARVALIRALGSFRDPQLLEKSLGLLLDGTLRSQDFWTLIGPSFARDETFAVTWSWFTTHYEQIVKLLGNKRVPRLPAVGTGFCSAQGRQQVAAFFAEPARQRPGIERNLANALERIDRCIRHRDHMRPAVVAFFE